jgi:hypothetical protein
MRMWIKVARYQLVQPLPYLLMPWVILSLSFAVCLVVFGLTPVSQHTVLTATGPVLVPDLSGRVTGALASIFVMFFVMGVQSIGRLLPFGLTLGASRRSYYAGTALIGVALAAADGLGVAALQAIERASGGWGVHMRFFRVPYLLTGPWYVTWLSSFVGLGLLYVYGMWFGIVYRRWAALGTIAFICAQVLAVLAGVVVVSLAHGWTAVGAFFTSLTAAGLTGVLAAAAIALLIGGQATIRRATV